MSRIEVNEQLLDDLVTGELRGEAYRQVLLAIEAQPHLWRQCALAFLREQAIQQDLRALARNALAEGSMDWLHEAAAPTTALPQEKPSRSSTSSTPSTTVQPALSPRSEDAVGWELGRPAGSSKALVQRFAALAALLLVSFSVGWVGAGLRFGDSLAEQARQASVSGMTANVLPGLGASDVSGMASSPTQLQMHYPSLNSMKVPAALIELERAGKVRIETVELLVPVTLDDGSSAIVPLLEYRVEPIAISY